MSKTSEKSNKGILSITFALEIIIDADGTKTFLLREPRTGQVLSMSTLFNVLIDDVESMVESFLKQPKGVRQG